MEHAISAAELLNAWERARSRPPADAALSLLAVADGASSQEQLARLSIGRRDAALLALREKVFGSRLNAQSNCPACGQPMEMSFSVADVQAVPPVVAAEQFTAHFGEHEISFRLPNSNDLASLTPGDVATQKRQLVQRCIMSVTRLPLGASQVFSLSSLKGGESRGEEALDFQHQIPSPQPSPSGGERESEARSDCACAPQSGSQCGAEQLSEVAINALSERMSELDPQGDVQLALSCPECSHCWQAPLDIASFVWNEIHAWAMRLLRDVHTLASAYGWREADILAMSPWRRQTYLELIER